MPIRGAVIDWGISAVLRIACLLEGSFHFSLEFAEHRPSQCSQVSVDPTVSRLGCVSGGGPVSGLNEVALMRYLDDANLVQPELKPPHVCSACPQCV